MNLILRKGRLLFNTSRSYFVFREELFGVAVQCYVKRGKPREHPSVEETYNESTLVIIITRQLLLSKNFKVVVPMVRG